MKDNFSVQSDDYVKFRPQYTQELIDYLVSITSKRNSCWDCGTGNGQLAVALSTYFENVKATDISENQLKNAIEVPNVEYSLQPAEETTFPDKTFDLITVAQAAHWFDHGKFNKEVKRLLTADGVIALFGYGLVQVDDELDPLIRSFYWNVTRPFWDPERDHIEARYKTIPFPYHELEVGDNFDIKRDMTLEELTGYIGTWSAVQHFIKVKGYHPVEKLKADLGEVWKNGSREVTFPVFIRVGVNSLKRKGLFKLQQLIFQIL